ncbi:MAG TPA: DUF3592 domain-containing protein [Cellvibrionaceae bacterium]|nr:DUF3592 domain-containing protein [Cellvibrionaceae bacterium]
MLIFFAILLVCLLVILIISTYLALSSSRWPKTKGSVISVTVNKKKTKSSGSAVVYCHPLIIYEYEVGGRQFKSARLDSRLVGYDKESDAIAIANLFAERREVDVFYHPLFPSIACLRAGLHGKWVYITLYFFGLLPLISILCII